MFIDEHTTERDESNERNGVATVKVIGVGGGGCNAVARMYHERQQGIQYRVLCDRLVLRRLPTGRLAGISGIQHLGPDTS